MAGRIALRDGGSTGTDGGAVGGPSRPPSRAAAEENRTHARNDCAKCVSNHIPHRFITILFSLLK